MQNVKDPVGDIIMGFCHEKNIDGKIQTVESCKGEAHLEVNIYSSAPGNLIGNQGHLSKKLAAVLSKGLDTPVKLNILKHVD